MAKIAILSFLVFKIDRIYKRKSETENLFLVTDVITKPSIFKLDTN